MARGGFTTVRDLGGDTSAVIAVRDAVAEGRFPGPRIKVAGAPLSIIGGHADEATGLPPELAEAVNEAHLNPSVCTGAEECQKVVRQLAAAGVDVIKIMATGGVLDPGARGLEQHFTDDEMKGICDMAHFMHLKVAAHAHGAKGIDAATPPASIRSSTAPSSTRPGVKEMKARGTYYVATLMAFSGVQGLIGTGKLRPRRKPRRSRRFAVWGKGLNLAYRNGVKIALGTDSAVAPHTEANKEAGADGHQGRHEPARRADRRDQGRARPHGPVERDRHARSRQVGRSDCSRGRPVGRSDGCPARRLCHGRGQSHPDERTMMRSSLLALSLLAARAPLMPPTSARRRRPDQGRQGRRAKADADTVKASVEEDAQPVQRSIPLRGHTLAYTATPGHLTIRNDKGEPTASMFYIAYTVPSADGARPVTFLFNGGPGSSTMWLHMGSFGPMKVDASIPETIAGPPFRYGAEPRHPARRQRPRVHRRADDRPVAEIGKAEPKDFFGVDKDLDAFTRTIQRYLTKYQRWNSPKFIIGESYGTTRAAGLSNSLLDAGVQLNGIAFVSTVLNFADFPGRPVADQLPSDLCGRRLVPRQDRRQAAARELPPAGPRRSRADPMRRRFRRATRSATTRSSRSRSRWRS